MSMEPKQDPAREVRGSSPLPSSDSGLDDFGAGVLIPVEPRREAPSREPQIREPQVREPQIREPQIREPQPSDSEAAPTSRGGAPEDRPRGEGSRSRRGRRGGAGRREREEERAESAPAEEPQALARFESEPSYEAEPRVESELANAEDEGASAAFADEASDIAPSEAAPERSAPGGAPDARDDRGARSRRGRRGGRGRQRGRDERRPRTEDERRDSAGAPSAPSDAALVWEFDERGEVLDEGVAPHERSHVDVGDGEPAEGWAEDGAPSTLEAEVEGEEGARASEGEAGSGERPSDSAREGGDGGRRRRRRRGGRRRRRDREGGPFGAEGGAAAPGGFAGDEEEREDASGGFDDPAAIEGDEHEGDFEGSAGAALEDDEAQGGEDFEGEGGERGDEDAGADGAPRAGESESASQRRRRRRRRRRSGDGRYPADDRGDAPRGALHAEQPAGDAAVAPVEEDEASAPAEGAPRQRERERDRRRGDRGGRRHRRDRDRDRDRDLRDDEDEDVEPTPRRSAGLQRLVINCVNEEESRVALVADGILDDIQVNVRSQSSYLGNIYKGRVVNLEPSIGAAFVDFGVGRNGFLHVSDVMPIYGREGFTLKKLLDPEWAQEFDPEDRGRGEARARQNITEFLKKGQEVLVQITKDGIGEKGPTLTTFVSIPGRYLVLMPSLTRCGVSRKIEDERERRRLRRILKDIETPPGMGVIVRTAGSKRTKDEIRADLEYLMQLWKDFSQKLATGRAPKELYEESDVALRTIRDIFTPDVKEIAVDDEQAFERICAFMNIASPGYVDRVKLYKGPTPIFHAYGVESQLEQLFARKVELPTGGSIVIDQAEALVAIDVNSGKSKESGDLEQTALRTNLAAIPEITRQMRLRDLGGIVVIDFIDMMDGSHRRQVERAFRAAIANDRARTKLSRISQFGLLEMTRQRLGPGLKKTFFEVCPHCQGMGHIKTPEAQSLGIIRDIQAVLGRKGFQHLEVKIRPEVEEFLANQKRREIFQLEERYAKRIRTVSDYRLPVGQVHFRFLTEDGREVRPSI